VRPRTERGYGLYIHIAPEIAPEGKAIDESRHALEYSQPKKENKCGEISEEGQRVDTENDG
jgi:hypothetical protein